jgi:hypothetical protein
VFLGLREEPGGLPEDVVTPVPVDDGAAVAGCAETAAPF